MAITNRAAIIKKTHTVLKKHYKPTEPVGRNVFEHLIFACCLENSRPGKAEECFAKLQELYFDWNEVRVTTVRELSEVFNGLSEPTTAAVNLKRTLQAVFETFYSFDLEAMKKQNLGAAVKKLEGFKGITPFVVAYVTQHGLGGHSIPLGKGAIGVMYAVGAIDKAEAKKGTVPGIERAVPKTKGTEFASLLQQVGAEFVVSPFSPTLRTQLTEIAKDAKDRLPKRGAKKKAAEAKQQAARERAEAREKAKKEAEAKAAKPKKKKKKKAEAKPAKAAKKKTVVKKKKVVKKKVKKPATKTTKKKKKSTSKSLTRRKPR